MPHPNLANIRDYLDYLDHMDYTVSLDSKIFAPPIKMAALSGLKAVDLEDGLEAPHMGLDLGQTIKANNGYNLENMLWHCAAQTDVHGMEDSMGADLLATQEHSVYDTTHELARQVTSPNKYMRKQAIASLHTWAELTGRSVTKVMAKHKDALADMTHGLVINIIHSLRTCAKPTFSEEALRVLRLSLEEFALPKFDQLFGISKVHSAATTDNNDNK